MTTQQRYDEIKPNLNKNQVVLIHKPDPNSQIQQKFDAFGNPALTVVHKYAVAGHKDYGWVEYAPAPVAAKKSTRTAKDS